MLLQFLSSLRLTLALLLGLALVAVFGTFEVPADNRYEVFYQSLWFRSLLALLALNLGACTLKTIRRKLMEPRRFAETLDQEQVSLAGAVRLKGDPPAEAVARLLEHRGWRMTDLDGRIIGRRGRPGRWGSTLVHLSLLVVMAGALTAEFGFVGTQTLYVGDTSGEYYDWSREADVPLGFELRLDHFEPVYYPIELRFAAVDPGTGRILETYTAREGESVALSGKGLSAVVRRFYPEAEYLVLDLYRNGVYLGEYQGAGGRRQPENALNPGFELRPVAYRDPVLKQLHSEVSILEAGRVVKQGVIEVNSPLTHDGVTIYQTAYNRDKFGFWAAGFQLSRDPGEPLVWAGSILLVAGLLLAFGVPYRALGYVRRGGEGQLVPLAGFRGEGGRRHLGKLAKELGEKTGDSQAVIHATGGRRLAR